MSSSLYVCTATSMVLSPFLKLVEGAFTADFERRVHQDVVIARVKSPLGCGSRKSADDFPSRGSLNVKRDGVGFVPVNVHEHRRAIQVGVDVVHLRERPGEIIGKNLIMDVDGSPGLAGIHAPSLLVEF